jgi:ATP-dependent exoDNAse (exonuclease V) alpha subunit
MEENIASARMTKNKVTFREKTNSLAVAIFEHDTSRELDPQLHSHAVVINTTKRKDGKWRALNNDEFYKNKMLAGAIYRAELAKKIRKLGYEVEVKTKDGQFELKGFDQDHLDHFSKRRQQILADENYQKFQTAKSAAVASVNTRKAKKDVDRAVIRKLWKEEAKKLGMKLEVPESENLSAKGEAEFKRECVSFAIEHMSERRSVFPKEELLRPAIEKAVGRIGIKKIEAEIEQRIKDKEIIVAPGGMYTTEKARKMEQSILDVADRGAELYRPILDHEDAVKEIQIRDKVVKKGGGFGYKDDQKSAIETVLTSKSMVTGIQGFAGTGKTFALDTIRDIAESQGLEVRGFSNTATATKLLSDDAKIQKAQTIAMFLAKKIDLDEFSKPQLWIVDEASMLGTKQADRLLKKAEKLNARVIMVGDKKQLPSIEAGKPFTMLMDRQKMRTATMDQIVRQKDLSLKEAVYKVIEDSPREKDRLKALRDSLDLIKKDVHQVEDRNVRLKAVSQEYMRDPSESLMITGTNADRKELNNQVRGTLRSQGELQGDELESTVLVSKSPTKAEIEDTRTYIEGDVVRFGKNYRSLGLEKGEYLTVKSVDLRLNEVTLQKECGSEVKWSPWKHGKVEIYSSEQRGLQVGDKIRWTRNDHKLRRRNGEAAKIVSIDEKMKIATVEVGQNGRKTTQKLDLKSEKHWEHGYASTIFSAQGKTIDKVIIHVDTDQKLVMGHEAWYVAISRAKNQAVVFTDDMEGLPKVIKRKMAKESALDAIEKGKSL